MSPSEVVEAQVAAYRDRDLERFLSFYAEDARIMDGDGRTLMTGIAEMRERYGASFAGSPALTIDIAERIVIGDYVIDEEHVANLGDPPSPDATARAVAIYRVTGDLISQVMLLR